MPNPLLRLGTPNVSQDPPVHAIDPVPEHVKGVNLPYRGMVDHGIPQPDGEQFTDPNVDRDTRDAYFEIEPEQQEPIPVTVVNRADTTYERRVMRARKVSVPRRGSQILGRDDRRISCKLQIPGAVGAAIPLTVNFPVGNGVQNVLTGTSGRFLGLFTQNSDTVAAFITVVDQATPTGVMDAEYVAANATGKSPAYSDTGYRFTNGLTVNRNANVATTPQTIIIWYIPDAQSVMIGNSIAALQAGDGYPMTPGSELSINTQSAVYAIATNVADDQTFVPLYVCEDIGEKIR